MPGIIDRCHYWMYVNDSAVLYLTLEIDLFVSVVVCILFSGFWLLFKIF